MKIVCDFDAVKKAGNKLVDQSSTLQTQTTTFNSALDSDLSGWTGADAKATFQKAKDNQIKFSIATAQQSKAVGEYIVICAKAIEEADNELASTMSI